MVRLPISRTFIRMYYQTPQSSTNVSTRIVDLRSDTVTKPSQAMRIAMQQAEVGDDVYKEDPTVNELEAKCAKLFGLDATLFVPSGTMANLISIMSHCHARRDCEIIVGNKQHIFRYEQGGFAQLAGVSAHVLTNNDDGTIDVSKVQSAIRDHSDFHQPKTEVICLENTHNSCGGRVLSLEYHQQIYNLAKENNLKIHLDGARLINAVVALKTSCSDIVKYVDSVSMCFSKGLGTPVGSVVGGSFEFIERAARIRKALGGGWRQAGVLAAACLVALEDCDKKLALDHENAKTLAKGICDLNSPFLKVNVEKVETNMVFVETVASLPADQLAIFLSQTNSDDDDDVSVLCLALEKFKIRLVTHCDITADDIQKVIMKFESLSKKLIV